MITQNELDGMSLSDIRIALQSSRCLNAGIALEFISEHFCKPDVATVGPLAMVIRTNPEDHRFVSEYYVSRCQKGFETLNGKEAATSENTFISRNGTDEKHQNHSL